MTAASTKPRVAGAFLWRAQRAHTLIFRKKSMDLLLKIVATAAMLLVVAYLWKPAKYAVARSRKADGQDWMSVLLPIAGVVLFVIVLIDSVR